MRLCLERIESNQTKIWLAEIDLATVKIFDLFKLYLRRENFSDNFLNLSLNVPY